MAMETVILRCYDLSQGMAAAMSRQLLGRQIDAIYHTGVLVFGREYFFQGGAGSANGIASATVREVEASFGMRPMQELQLGSTRKTKAEWLEFVRRVGSTRFRHDGYNLIENNCNNFSDEAAKFLLGTGIPAHITGLPREILNGPLGSMLRPMMERMSMGGGGGGFASPPSASAFSIAGPPAAEEGDLVDFSALMADDGPKAAAAAAAPTVAVAAPGAPAPPAADVLQPPADSPTVAAALALLTSMGFEDDGARRAALDAAQNDVSVAIALLVS